MAEAFLTVVGFAAEIKECLARILPLYFPMPN